MPRALNADWSLAQTLYTQGVPYRAIAEEVGVTEMSLRQRAHRHGWPALKTEALATVSRAVTGHTGKTLVQRSGEVRAALGEELQATVGALRQTPLKASLDHLEQRADVTAKLAGAASKVHNWLEHGETPLIHAFFLRILHVPRPELNRLFRSARSLFSGGADAGTSWTNVHLTGQSVLAALKRILESPGAGGDGRTAEGDATCCSAGNCSG
jgi:stress-induced morphogen